MCRFNLCFNIDDQVVDAVQPNIGNDTAMQAWMIEVVKQAMKSYANELRIQTSTKAEGERLLHKLADVKKSEHGFLQLGGILGKPRRGFSWDELREEAYTEKYGI